MSIKPQKLTEIRDFYDLRFRVLSETIEKVCSKIENDELIAILKEDEDSQQFTFDRIKEIFEEFIKEDRVLILQKITEKFEEKSEKMREYKENIEKMTKGKVEFEEIIRGKEAEINGFRQKNKEFEEILIRMKAFEEENQDLKAKKGNLEEKLREYEEKQREYEEKHRKSEEKHRKYEEKDKEIEEKLREIEERYKELEEKHRETLEILKDLDLKNKSLIQENNDFSEKILILSDEIQLSEEKSLEKAQLNQKNEELLKDLNILKAEFEVLKEKLKVSSEKFNETLDLKANYKKKMALIEKLSQGKKKYKAKVLLLTEEIKKNKEKTSENQENEVFKAENRRLEMRNRENEENFQCFQKEIGQKYQELLEFSNGETMKRAEIEKKYETNLMKIKEFSMKIKEKLREMTNFSEEMRFLLDFRGFIELFSKIKDKTLEIPAISKGLLDLNKRNEEISMKYMQKLEFLELNYSTNSVNFQEYLGKINILTKKLKELTEILNISEKKTQTQEEEIKTLKKNQYNMRLLFEEKVYKLEKELSNKEKERAQTSRKEETLYQNLQKKYRYHNLLRKGEDEDKNNEENTTFGEIKNHFISKNMGNKGGLTVNNNYNNKGNRRKLSLKEF